jgi:putative SOS response-associated peptidase YedK
MCGRYASFIPADRLHRLFRTVNPTPNLQPTWNMAPTRDAPVVRLHPDTRERHLDLLRWGLVPHWARDAKATRQPINARAETLATSPMFRDALGRRRCLVPADAFYEWQAAEPQPNLPNTSPANVPAKLPAKLPWAIARADGTPLVFAGLWEGWRGADGTVLRTFTIVTTQANDALRRLHERMPVVLEPDAWPLWLGETEGQATDLLRPSAAEFRVWRVGTKVNNVRNDGAELLDPVAG